MSVENNIANDIYIYIHINIHLNICSLMKKVWLSKTAGINYCLYIKTGVRRGRGREGERNASLFLKLKCASI